MPHAGSTFALRQGYLIMPMRHRPTPGALHSLRAKRGWLGVGTQSATTTTAPSHALEREVEAVVSGLAGGLQANANRRRAVCDQRPASAAMPACRRDRVPKEILWRPLKNAPNGPMPDLRSSLLLEGDLRIDAGRLPGRNEAGCQDYDHHQAGHQQVRPGVPRRHTVQHAAQRPVTAESIKPRARPISASQSPCLSTNAGHPRPWRQRPVGWRTPVGAATPGTNTPYRPTGKHQARAAKTAISTELIHWPRKVRSSTAVIGARRRAAGRDPLRGLPLVLGP